MAQAVALTVCTQTTLHTHFNHNIRATDWRRCWRTTSLALMNSHCGRPVRSMFVSVRVSVTNNQPRHINAVLKWGKAECKRQEKKSDSGDDLKSALGDVVNLIRFPIMSLEEIAAHVAPRFACCHLCAVWPCMLIIVFACSNMLGQDALLELFKYVSITDEKERAATTLPFSAKPRGGALSWYLCCTDGNNGEQVACW